MLGSAVQPNPGGAEAGLARGPSRPPDCVGRPQAHDGYILKCLLSPDVRLLATASSDRTVKLWNLDGFKLERVLEGHQRWVWDCVFSVDAAYLAR